MSCPPDCTCRGERRPNGTLTPCDPGYDAAVAHALDLIVAQEGQHGDDPR